MRKIGAILMIVIITSFSMLGCGDGSEQAVLVPFSIEVNPPVITHAYVGQAYTFSVTISSEESGKAVNISALVNDCYLTINPDKIKPGEVSKVVVVPLDSSVGKTLVINIEGERGGLIERATVSIQMGDTGDTGEGI
ncbi:MAG: hypothetical protein JSV74_00510 [Dehalococcoidia bacterium]|nr:MAG: hypothetical protein JSV74_00510 [Dehalococcoidia bacterium]